MIVLHTMPRIGWGLLAPSPFCAKVELWLRLAGLPHTLRPGVTAAGSPRGKLPWIEHDGRPIADSEDILRRLADDAGDPLREAEVDADDAARAHLVRRTVEESLYFAIVAERWRDPRVRSAYTRDLLASFPAPARPLVRRFATRLLLDQLWKQGTGRHPQDAVTARAGADLDAVARVLGDRPFFTGDAPRAVDAAVFGQLANLWWIPIDTPTRTHLARHENLVAFLERLRAGWIPDVPAVTPRAG